MHASGSKGIVGVFVTMSHSPSLSLFASAIVSSGVDFQWSDGISVVFTQLLIGCETMHTRTGTRYVVLECPLRFKPGVAQLVVQKLGKSMEYTTISSYPS